MKLRYPLTIGLIFIVLVVSNNELAKRKAYHFYRDVEQIDDPVRKELENNKLLSDEAGAETVVINLWATWCGPCQKEIPDLNRLMDKYEDENILFIAVTGETEKEVLAWIDLQKNEPEYFQLFEKERLIDYLFSLNPDKSIKKGRYPELLPTNLIINKGKVVFFRQGFSEENIAQMDSVLNQLSFSQ